VEADPMSVARQQARDVVISVRSVSKSFAATAALTEVSIDGHAGSIHAVTGENGAGKSTLMKLLAGVYHPDAGEICMNGHAVHFADPSQALRAGISTVFQEMTLLPNLTIAENMLLGREPGQYGWLDRAEIVASARNVLRRIGIDLDVERPCGTLTIGERQLIEIAKGVSTDAAVFIFDEPTAALSETEVDKLESQLRALRDRGKSLFYISHRLEEIFRFCDTVTVLKDGRRVTTMDTTDLDVDRLVTLMVGRPLISLFPARGSPQHRVALDIRNFVATAGAPAVSFELRRGEIAVLFGLEGQHQREILRGLAGALAPQTGEFTKTTIDGAKQTYEPRGGIARCVADGVALIPEDRRLEGIFLDLSIEQNFVLGQLRGMGLARRVRRDAAAIARLMATMQLHASRNQTVRSLSGGNQQKVMLGRWLQTTIDTLLIEEPTRGIDVGAKVEIYRLLRDFAEQEGAVLLVSSELIEVIGLSDRILVVRAGSIVAELDSASATERSVLEQSLRSDSDDRRSATRPVTQVQQSRSGISRYTVSIPVLLFVALALTAPHFLDGQNVSNLAGQVTALLLVTLGQLLVCLVAGMDLSVGSVVSLASCIAATQSDPVVLIFLTMTLGLLVGLVNGCGVAVAGLHPLIMTLSSMTFLQGLSLLVLPIPGGGVPPFIQHAVKATILGMPASLAWCAVAMALVGVLLYRTRLGLHIFAVGANWASARLNGVRSSRVTVTAYVLCSLLSVAAGLYLSGRVSSGDPTMGQAFALDSITAVALGGVRLTGGVGSIFGVFTGTLTLGFVTNGINLLGISPFLRLVVTGTLLLVAICTQRRSSIGL
jgi:ribose transport system ATP-binding protein